LITPFFGGDYVVYRVLYHGLDPSTSGVSRMEDHQMFSSNDTSNDRSPAVFRSPRVLAAAVTAVSLLAMACSTPAAADMGPCNTAAPSTRTVHLFVSDVDRSARWYRDNAGLTEERRWVDPSFGGATLVQLGHGRAGLTLVSAPQQQHGGFHEPQMACLVLDGPPAPPVGSGARYLVDPDGTSVELPPYRGDAPWAGGDDRRAGG
jgi:hypothetical protein